VTGPLVGLSEDATFDSVTVALRPGDTIVLATDGLTEARDSSGVPVDDDGVMRWIRDGDQRPEALASELTQRVSRFAGGRINDDLALLILQFAAKANVSGDGSGALPPVEGTAAAANPALGNL